MVGLDGIGWIYPGGVWYRASIRGEVRYIALNKFLLNVLQLSDSSLSEADKWFDTQFRSFTKLPQSTVNFPTELDVFCFSCINF